MITISSTVDEQYYEVIEADNQKPKVIVEYLDDDGVWQELPDVLSFSHSKRIRDDRMGVYALLPPTSTLNLTLANKDNYYTPNSGNAGDGVISIGRQIRIGLSYELDGI